MSHTWKFVLSTITSPTTHSDVGELYGASERTVTRAFNSAATAACRIPIERAEENGTLLPLLTSDCMLRAYRGSRLMFHGPVQSVELSAQDANTQPSIAITAADPSINFTKRLANKNTTPSSQTGGRIAIFETLLGSANTDGITGVKSRSIGGGTSTTFNVGPYKPLSDVLTELAVGPGSGAGFDWFIDPIEEDAGYMGAFQAATLLGTQREEAVFEYQGRANMRAPVFQRQWDTLANAVYHIHPSGPQVTDGVRSDSDTTSITYRGRYEAVAEGDLTDNDLRDQLVDAHILYRKGPRQVMQFQPEFEDGVGPEYGTDYDLGDRVRALVRYRNLILVDGWVRLYKMQFDIDANNLETLTPTLVTE